MVGFVCRLLFLSTLIAHSFSLHILSDLTFYCELVFIEILSMRLLWNLFKLFCSRESSWLYWPGSTAWPRTASHSLVLFETSVTKSVRYRLVFRNSQGRLPPLISFPLIYPGKAGHSSACWSLRGSFILFQPLGLRVSVSDVNFIF